jgi:putative membrane protein
MEIGFFLASFNAALNATAACLLLFGWFAIRRKREDIHKRCMSTAFVLSCIFLISYLTRISIEGVHRYPGEGWDRTFYLTLLSTHITLAASVPALAGRTMYLAIKRRIATHRKWARWTLPIWMYVSVTGVVIYLMLYHLNS